MSDVRPEPGALHHRVVIVGGGNAGLSTAGRLRRRGVDDIAVIEPRDQHLYKPLFSHIAGGRARASEVIRRQGEVTPAGVRWIRDAVTAVEPERNAVALASGRRVSYEHLVVCPGIQNDWDAVPGLAGAMASPSGASNYELDLAVKASRLLRDVRGGTVLFVQPPGPASCAGAGQKPMYLACDYWRATGVLGDIRVILVVADPTVFGIDLIDAELERKIAEYGIELRTDTVMDEVDAAARTVTLRRTGTTGETERIGYDVLMVEPPQSAPDWLKASPLAAPDDPGGFVDIDPQTLRHRRYTNVWALGDAAATATSKSGGALRKQTLALAKNIRSVLDATLPSTTYDGYTVCPFTVSRSTVVFAEFDGDYRLRPTIPFWKGFNRERRLTWILDRWVLPWAYWRFILQGRL